MYETYREWHFSFAPKRNVQVLLMHLDEEKSRREKTEQQVRDLVECLSSGAQPGTEIQPPRQERKVYNKEKKSLEEMYEEKRALSDELQQDLQASQANNFQLDNILHQSGKDSRALQAIIRELESEQERLEKQLEKCRNQKVSRRDSYTQTEVVNDEGIASQTTMANDDQSLVISRANPMPPPTSQSGQEDKIAELQRENDRLRQETLRCNALSNNLKTKTAHQRN
jgi:DNA repair exonuclease SbcCD ATPase subunit